MDGTPSNTVVEIRSTPELAPKQVFEQWEDVLSRSYAPVAVARPQLDRFHGRIRLATYDAVNVSSLSATAQQIYRSQRMLGAPADPVLWAVFSTNGFGRLEHAGRTAEYAPGGLLFYDTVRPLRAHFEGSWSIAPVQLPLSAVLERTGLSLGRLPTAVRIPSTGAIGIVERFCRGLLEMQDSDPAAATMLGEHAIDLVSSAVLLAAGVKMTEQPAQALARQQVLAFVKRHYTDPDLGVEQIARACAVSRRTLYRLFDTVDGGVSAVIRRRRIARAQAMLCADPARSTASIAAACGFASERNFYRLFKQETGTTPGEYRMAHR
ncbi:helix-turn-helix domain-containing protein [Nocardia mexicana]|uniref:AraC family transcriptional regulator n=1 Tax=Nocardia mexicana TaxID=279262 RepID=A0A370HC27_9NOCA|nr:helix-turn-helix domain-containing protein [Nocardia mexicana]RDI54482.1 AraC family transcriptional regulator [Nocardia mexicana]